MLNLSANGKRKRSRKRLVGLSCSFSPPRSLSVKIGAIRNDGERRVHRETFRFKVRLPTYRGRTCIRTFRKFLRFYGAGKANFYRCLTTDLREILILIGMTNTIHGETIGVQNTTKFGDTGPYRNYDQNYYVCCNLQ